MAIVMLRRFAIFSALFFLSIPIGFACLPAPFEPAGTKIERTDENSAFISTTKLNGALFEHLVINPGFRGDAADFGIILAFPSKPEVREAADTLFKTLDFYTKPRQREMPRSFDGDSAEFPGAVSAEPPSVTVIEQKEVGDFISTILTANDTSALLDWLKKRNYNFDENDEKNFEYYVKNTKNPLGQYYFAALQINIKKNRNKSMSDYELKPIEYMFQLPSASPILPLGLTRDQDPVQSLTLYTLGKNPYVIPGALIPFSKKLTYSMNDLRRYTPTGKWLSKLELRINPATIEGDLELAAFTENPQEIHIYEDETPPFVTADKGEEYSKSIVLPGEYAELISSQSKYLPSKSLSSNFFSMFQSDLNLWAVLVAGLAAYVLGALWYSPLLFGNAWVKLMGWSNEQMEHHKKGAARGYVLGLVTALLMAFILAHVIFYTGATEWQEGLEAGFWMWLGFVATVQLGGFLWEGKKFSLYLLNTGYNLTALLGMGVILAIWP